MKRRIALFIIILSLTLVMLMPAQAAERGLVYDEVGVLTEDEYFELNELAQNITDRYECEVSILVIKDKGDDSIKEAAKYFYEKHGYGYGEDNDGLMLLLSMEDRDNVIIAYGYGNTAFTDYGKDALREEYLLPKLRKDQYYEGFLVYLEQTAEYLQMAEDGEPFDISSSGDSPWIKWAIFIFTPLLVAGGVCFMFLSQMKTAVSQRAADSYIPGGGFNLTMQADQFLYRTETRTKIEKESSGGSSTDSDGYSSSSGKF